MVPLIIILSGLTIWYLMAVKAPVDREIKEGEKYKREEIGTLTIEDIMN